MKVRPYTEADAERWDNLVREADTGTFLHTRRFLSYHGSRFVDLSVVCEDGKNNIVAVFPAAMTPDGSAHVVSHPGATYGGFLFRERSGISAVGSAMTAVIEHYRARGLKALEYRSVPTHLRSPVSQADLYVLWKHGATLLRRDLWSVVSLSNRTRYTKGHKWAIARAKKSGVTVRTADDESAYRAFHAVLEACLTERHGVFPVHSLDEMLMLRDKFPRDIALWVAHDSGGEILAGCWVFMFSRRAWHTQYIASTAQGRECCATHLMLDCTISEATRRGVAYFSFGNNTEEGGLRLNTGLLDFKTGFGAGTICHDIYLLDLERGGLAYA